MKTIYLLKDFHNAVKEIAALGGIDYTSVSVEMGNDGTTLFRSYVSGYNWSSGETIEQSLTNLKKQMGLYVPQDIDVILIESEN